MARYERRFVGYLDIMGFKAKIGKTIGDNPAVTVNQIIMALNAPGAIEEGKIILGEDIDISKADHKMTIFSDSILISTEFSTCGLLKLLQHLERISFRLLREFNFLGRGGISLGDIYHEDNIVFGPAVNEAVDLEKEKAYFPRIILGENVSQYGASELGESEKLFFDRYTKLSSDNYYFVHMLRQYRTISDCYMNNGYVSNPSLLGKWLKTKSHFQRERDCFHSESKQYKQLNWFCMYYEWATSFQGDNLDHIDIFM